MLFCSKTPVAELTMDPESFEGKYVSKGAQMPYCVCLSWSADGSLLFGGYTDGIVRIWEVTSSGM